MTINQIIEKFKTDTAFAEKYSALKSMDAILEQAKADGFDVTAEDVQAAMNELGKKSGELSEADLTTVAGGNPKGERSDNCYFKASAQKMFRDNAMREKCGQDNCRTARGHNAAEYYFCNCWGTDKCIDMWHIEARCPIRPMDLRGT